MKILFYQWHSFMNEGVERAWKQLGLEYDTLFYQQSDWEVDDGIVDLLEKKLKHQEDLHTCVCMVKNLMKLGDFEKAHEILQIIEKKWHRHEAYWILKVQYCVEQKQGEELKRTLDKMKKEHIYLSSKGREDLALWIDS